MEKIINNPGFQHLAENLFLNLDQEYLEICAMINQSCKQILDNPIFWLKIFVSKGMSKKNETDWAKAIKSAKKSEKKKHFLLYLKWHLKKEKEVDFQLYTNSSVQKTFRQQLSQAVLNGHTEIVRALAPLTKSIKTSKKFGHDLIHNAAGGGYAEIIKILIPLVKDPNAPDKRGFTPIHWAAKNGHTEIIQILATFIDNLTVAKEIYWAIFFGHTEIVKILASLTDNPNAPDKDGYTPIHVAAEFGRTEIVKFLASLTDNPNVADNDEETPIHMAAKNGHTEIVKILAPMTDNPNVADKYGETPIHMAAKNGNTEIVKILAPLTNNPNTPNSKGETPSSVTKNKEIQKFLEYINTSVVHTSNMKSYKKSSKRSRKSEPMYWTILLFRSQIRSLSFVTKLSQILSLSFCQQNEPDQIVI